MPAIANLQDLFVHQLRDLYSAEKQLLAALPKMGKRSTSDELQEAISSHLEQTTSQVSRLERVFEQLGVSSRGPKCKAMEGLIEEGKEMLEEDIEPHVLDAGIIAASQRVEHYEIAAYGTVVEFARVLGHNAIGQLLQQTLDEEIEADETLTELAEGGINAMAQGGESLSDDEAETEPAPRRALPRGATKAASKSVAPATRTGARRR
jgi:ferritin-like metal-binding protein YciE